jgi:DNA polymerase III alpha subunit (gram-positive type)
MIALVLDTETTALIPNRKLRDDMLPEIIEFYGEVVNLADGAVITQLDCLIRPRQALKAETTDITGITNEMLAGQPSFKECANAIFTFIESAEVVIAHNMTYDQECLDIEAERLAYSIKWPRTICSVEQSEHLTGKRLSLGKLHEHLFGQKFADAHRAKSDVKALTRCCVELFKRGEL